MTLSSDDDFDQADHYQAVTVSSPKLTVSSPKVTVSTPLTILRKGSHLLAVMLLAPPILLDPGFASLALAAALALFLLAEAVRAPRLRPLGPLLQSFYSAFTDSRDSGELTLTHVFLLLGCAVPVWVVTALAPLPTAPARALAVATPLEGPAAPAAAAVVAAAWRALGISAPTTRPLRCSSVVFNDINKININRNSNSKSDKSRNDDSNSAFSSSRSRIDFTAGEAPAVPPLLSTVVLNAFSRAQSLQSHLNNDNFDVCHVIYTPYRPVQEQPDPSTISLDSHVNKNNNENKDDSHSHSQSQQSEPPSHSSSDPAVVSPFAPSVMEPWWAPELPAAATVTALAGLITLGVGDSAASIAGTLLRGPRWPGGGRKTLAGTLAAAAATGAAVAAVLGGLARGGDSVGAGAVAVLAAGAALLEAATAHVDNLFLPLWFVAAAAVMLPGAVGQAV